MTFTTHTKGFVEDQYDGNPCMTDKEIRAIEKIMESWGVDNGRVIFEWGSGGSTKYFMEVLNYLGVNFEWYAAEHCSAWADKVRASVDDPKLNMCVFDYGGYTRHETKSLCMKEYVEAPINLEKKFDMLIVDGRKRARCLKVAKGMVKRDGIVLLHDAQREYYSSALNDFQVSQIICDELWGGSL